RLAVENESHIVRTMRGDIHDVLCRSHPTHLYPDVYALDHCTFWLSLFRSSSMNSLHAFSGLPCCMKFWPIKNPSYPTLRKSRIVSGDSIPLSDTFTTSFGIIGASSLEMSRLIVKVFRLRLFTPIKSAPASRLYSSSSRVCTSNSTSRPNECANAVSDFSAVASRAAAIRSITSAPIDLASMIWYSSTVKSFRRIGQKLNLRAVVRSALLPPKYF